MDTASGITTIMRFKKGTKIEVLREDVPAGSWHCAEIVCGNGHSYGVRYTGYRDNADTAIMKGYPGKPSDLALLN